MILTAGKSRAMLAEPGNQIIILSSIKYLL